MVQASGTCYSDDDCSGNLFQTTCCNSPYPNPPQCYTYCYGGEDYDDSTTSEAVIAGLDRSALGVDGNTCSQ